MQPLIVLVVAFLICSANGLNKARDCQCRLKSTPRIQGGTESNRANVYPWMVSIGRKPDTPWDEQPDVYKKQNKLTLPAAYMKETHMCGGILLNENFVLTAAHCLFRNNVPLSASQVAVGFGHNLVQVYQDGRVSVKKVITHEKFERVGKGLNEYSRHDIALLQLTYPRSFVKDIDMSPACLSTSKSAGTDAQKMLTAIGFGGTKAIRMDKQSYEMGHKPKVEISALLRELNLVDISPNHPLCSLNKQLICTQALSGNGSLCLGDSGSPLQIIKQGRIGVIGISSFSDEKVDGNYVWFCAKSSMFTRVDEHLDWIKKHVGNDYCEL